MPITQKAKADQQHISRPLLLPALIDGGGKVLLLSQQLYGLGKDDRLPQIHA